jgi:diacylglycerol kinase (ATP)
MLADAIATGWVRTFDLARTDRRLFCLMASVGIDADVVHRVHRRRRGHINRLSYLVPALQAIQNYRFPSVEVEIDESGECLQGAAVFVFNLPEYALQLPIATDGSAEDGLLDLCVFEKPGLFRLLRYLKAIILRKHGDLPDFQHRRVRRVRLCSNGSAPLQTDGDPAGCLPASIEVLPGALPLVVPQPRSRC